MLRRCIRIIQAKWRYYVMLLHCYFMIRWRLLDLSLLLIKKAVFNTCGHFITRRNLCKHNFFFLPCKIYTAVNSSQWVSGAFASLAATVLWSVFSDFAWFFFLFICFVLLLLLLLWFYFYHYSLKIVNANLSIKSKISKWLVYICCSLFTPR